MAVSHGESGLAAAALSTGEQKCLLLSIVLGAARIQAEKRGFAPLLLLDEVSAHLDQDHRRALYAEVAALGAQAWMTGTDATLFSSLGDGARFLRIDEGCVQDLA